MIRLALIILVLSAAPAKTKTADPLEKVSALVAARKYDDAEKTVRAAMKKNPGANGYHLALGRVLLAKGAPSDAYVELLYEGMRAGAAPESATAFEEAADVVANVRGIEGNDARRIQDATEKAESEPEESLALLRQVSKAHASHFVVRFLAAEAKLRAGDFEPALQEFRALSKEDRWFVPAVVQEAMTLRALGRQKDAEAAAARAREIAPDHWALKSLELLAKPLPSPALTPKPKATPAPR